jgi:hypothetical protein
VGSQAHWDAEARAITCLSCLIPAAPPSPVPDADVAPEREEPIDRGVAGTSALREHGRRKRNREQRTLQAHPHIGRLLLALRDEPQHELAFFRGAYGETAVAESLEARTSGSPTVLLHDRRMPHGHGNIDHLAISPNGIFVIDAKDWQGRVRVTRSVLGKTKLSIQGRDRTTLIDGLDRQVAAVGDALGHLAQSWPIQGVLCFTRADLPLLGTTKMRSHLLLRRKALAHRLNASGPFTLAEINAIARILAETLPPA